MTGKPRCNHSHTAVVGFGAILIALILLSASVHVLEAGQNSAQRSVESSPQHFGAAASQQSSPDLSTTDGYALGFLPAATYYVPDGLPNDMEIGDLNGDGRPDLFAANVRYQAGAMAVLRGNGDGTFQNTVNYRSGGGNSAWGAVADVNEDGRDDAIVANAGGSVGVLLANSWGRLKPAVIYADGIEPNSLAAGDLNGDGHIDLVIAGTCSAGGAFSVLLGNGDGTFQPAVTYGVPATISIKSGDVNGDGKPDLVAASYCSTYSCDTGAVNVMLGNGDGTFQPAVTYSSGGHNPVSIAIGDINVDGHLDLIVANACETPAQNGACYTESGQVSVLLGNGNGTFQPPIGYNSGGLQANSVAIGDMNGDGKPDLVVANLSVSLENHRDAVGVLLGKGDGTFESAAAYVLGHYGLNTVAIADLNGDGRPDIAAANRFGALTVLLNSSGTNTPTTTTLGPSLDPAPLNKVVTYTAIVGGQSGVSATGTVVFKEGSTTIASVPVDKNQAAYSRSYNAGGVHSITALYTGDWNHAGSVSAPLTQYIQSLSRTSLTTSGSPAYVGQPVTFTVAVSSAAGTIPDGELVTFYDGTATVASVALLGGTATYTTSALSAKTHYIQARYAGDTKFIPSTASVTQMVVKYPTTTVLSSSPNPSAYGQPVTFSAMVASTGPVPTGKVFFKNGTNSMTMVELNGGVATLTKRWLPTGTLAITVQYLGDDVSAGSSSSILNQVVH